MDDLIDVILKLKNKDEALDFMIGILTPKELTDIMTRLQIVRLLKQGVAHQTIAKQLGVGVATVTRGSKEIQNGRFKNIK